MSTLFFRQNRKNYKFSRSTRISLYFWIQIFFSRANNHMFYHPNLFIYVYRRMCNCYGVFRETILWMRPVAGDLSHEEFGFIFLAKVCGFFFFFLFCILAGREGKKSPTREMYNNTKASGGNLRGRVFMHANFCISFFTLCWSCARYGACAQAKNLFLARWCMCDDAVCSPYRWCFFLHFLKCDSLDFCASVDTNNLYTQRL